MSRSVRYHQEQQMRDAPDGFPTPPSSASTPPATTTPPVAPSGSRISMREHSPRPHKRQRLDVDHSLSNDETTGESTTDSHTDGSTVRIQRIRLKYSEPVERRISDSLTGKQASTVMVHEMSEPGMDDVERETETSDREMDLGKPVEWEVSEMVEETENWRIIGLNNVGNTCFTNAILQVFSQTEILGKYFIQRYPYSPPSRTNPMTSADLSSRASRSKTRRNQAIPQEIPAPSEKTLCSSFSRLLRALRPSVAPPNERLGIAYHQPKKHRSDSKYTIAPREFIGDFNIVYPYFRKGESQEDAMEFFSKVRERLHDELRADLDMQLRKSHQVREENEQWLMEKTPISDIFRGYYVTKRTCTVCNTERDAPLEETWQLPVAVPSSITPNLQPHQLPDLIAHYGGVEKDVNIDCRHCARNTPHDSRPSYLQTPRVLVIQALRFLMPKSPLDLTLSLFESESSLPPSGTGTESPASSGYSSSEPLAPPPPKKRPPPKKKVLKNPVHITFPLKSLDMTSYLRTSSPQEELYDLYGVVEHVGRQMDGGHYIAYIRGKDSRGSDHWWKCNDAKCWMVSDEIVSSAQGYIWFYERRAERGQVPEDWPSGVGGEKSASPQRAALPTPESDERPVVGVDETGRTLDGSWHGRLRASISS